MVERGANAETHREAQGLRREMTASKTMNKRLSFCYQWVLDQVIGFCMFLYELQYVIYSWRPVSVQCWKEFKLLVCIVLVSLVSFILLMLWMIIVYIKIAFLKPVVVVHIHTPN